MHLTNLTASSGATNQYSEFEIYILRINPTSFRASIHGSYPKCQFMDTCVNGSGIIAKCITCIVW